MRARYLLTGLLVVLVATLVGANLVHLFDAQRQSLPSHVEPAVARVPTPLAVAGADYAGDVFNYVTAVRQAQEEADRVALLNAAAQAQSSSPSRSVAASSSGGTCEGFAVPGYIVWRESHCDYGAINPTGCGGWTCVGAYQFDLRHWMDPAQGGWGGCTVYGDWRDPAAQDACAEQMSHGGTNLAPWGG